MFDKILNYAIARITSPYAWIGLIGAILEIIMHGPYMSTVMFMLFMILFFAPADSVNALFAKWTKTVRDLYEPPKS